MRWEDEAWAFAVYDHYMRDVFFFNAPKAFGDYRGGHALVEHYYADRIDFAYTPEGKNLLNDKNIESI